MGVRVTPFLDTISTISVKSDIGVEREPDITFNGSNYIVVWSEGDFGGMHKVRAARVTPEGAVLDSGIFFGMYSYLEYHPSVSFGGNHCLAVWYAYDEPYGVFARFLNDQAQPVGDAFEITLSQANHYYNPDIAYADGRYLIVWTEQTPYAGDEVFGQIIDTSGVLINDKIPIAVGPEYQSMPRVAAGSTFLAVWSQGGKICGQRISTDGQLLGLNFEISAPVGGNRSSPDIAFGSENCLAVWMQYDINSYDIYGNLDTPVGTCDNLEIYPRCYPHIPTIIAGRLDQFIGSDNYAVYDVAGRQIQWENTSPGIYFVVGQNQGTIKIIKTR